MLPEDHNSNSRQVVAQRRIYSVAKAQQVATNQNSKRATQELSDQQNSMHSSKQRLANLENSSTKAKDSRKSSQPGTKQNKSVILGSKNSLPPSAVAKNNHKLVNATIKAMITNQKPTTSKSKGIGVIRKQTGRAKSACKGGGSKAEMFNSTAPIKFFSNLEDTVREITQGNQMNFKLNSLSKGRQSYQLSKEPYKTGNTADERSSKVIQGGTQQIIVPKIQQPQPMVQQRPPSTNLKRTKLVDSALSQKHTAQKQGGGNGGGVGGSSYLSSSILADQTELSLETSNNLTITDQTFAQQEPNNTLVKSSLISSMHLQGDYTMPSQQMKQKNRQQNPVVIKTKASSGAVVTSGTSSTSITNSKIKLRIAQQKTRSSSSISNAQRSTLNNTQKGLNDTKVSNSGFAVGVNEQPKSGTHLKMTQIMQQPQSMVTKLTSMKTQSVKSRQNQTSELNALTSEISQQQVAEIFINAKQSSDKDQKLTKSFQCKSTTAASKKQRQTLKGMIEGLNASIPSSSSKRKSNQPNYVANTMHVQKQRQPGVTHNIDSAVTAATVSASIAQSQMATQTHQDQQNKDKLQSSQHSQLQSSSTHARTAGQTGSQQNDGSKSSSSLTQLPGKQRQNNKNNSLLMFNSTQKKIVPQIVGPKMHQITRVDFEKLNQRQATESNKGRTATNSELMKESYQDIVKSGEQTCVLNLSQKGLTLSTQKAFLSNSNRINLPKRGSIEESSGQFATQTESGPQNPFLEQILREIPNAYSGNASGQTSAGTTGILNMEQLKNNWNNEIQVHLNDRSEIGSHSDESKKTFGKILKNFQSKINISSTQKDQMAKKFNLTSTAAALLATSDRNASEFQRIETRTFETRTHISTSNNVSRTELASGYNMNSNKKQQPQQNLNQTTDDKLALAAEKKACLNQRLNESRGHIRLASQKRSSKSSYSGSQKRQKEALVTKINNSHKAAADQRAIYISEQAQIGSEKQEPLNNSKGGAKKSHLSQTRLPNNAIATTQNRYGSLINVVKVAAKQKVNKVGGRGATSKQSAPRQKQQTYSMNTTQTLEEQLLQLKLNSNSGKNNQITIPQKSSNNGQLKNRGQLNTSTGNISSIKQPTKKGNSPVPQDHTPKDATGGSQLQQQALCQYSNDSKHRYAKQQLQSSKQRKMPVKMPQQRIEQRGKTNEPAKLKSNQLKFDWSGFLQNLMHENFQPKKSISGPGNVIGSTLCERPYQLQEDIQNKTQPLPKGLLQKNSRHQHNAYDLQNNKVIMPKATEAAYGAPHLQKTESRGSEYRPRIGRKQIEIAPVSGAKTNFAATMTQNQLRQAKEDAIQVINVLTEVTEPGDTEKESPTSVPSTHRTPSKVNEDYKFGKLLGEGAYAEVRLAYKKSEGKNYAAKIYDKSKLVDDHRRNSVCREVMLMQKLKHPFVVQFSEAFETDHHVYLIIEYITGKSLHDYLKRQRATPTSKTEFDQTLSEDEAKRLIRQLLQSLEFLHGQGISHRDIKLENILLDQDLNVKVIDFGFSTCYQPQRKQRMFCGTPSYMAPEIVSRVEYYGPPADIWATGVLLFCLLNGFFPFKGQTDAELYRKINRGAFKMIRSDLSDDCLNVLKEMLNVNPDSRMTASELLQENWFLTDLSKKRSIAEIRREFKAKILKKCPVRSVNKNTICIPATKIGGIMTKIQTEADSVGGNQDEEEKHNGGQQDLQLSQNLSGDATQHRGILANNSMQFYRRDFNHASPPSMMPSQSQQTQQNIASFMNRTSDSGGSAHHGGGEIEGKDGTNDEPINQEALLAYYNTSGMHVHPQASAPPSGKFNLTTPYSAYNQWPVHQQGSPPSIADMPHSQTHSGNPQNQTPTAEQLQDPSSVYVSRPFDQELTKMRIGGGEDSGIVDATDVDIIIQHGRGTPVRNNIYANVPEYRDQIEDIYSAVSSSVPANKQ